MDTEACGASVSARPGRSSAMSGTVTSRPAPVASARSTCEASGAARVTSRRGITLTACANGLRKVTAAEAVAPTVAKTRSGAAGAGGEPQPRSTKVKSPICADESSTTQGSTPCAAGGASARSRIAS